MEQNILEGNKLIAEFMGMEVSETGLCKPYPKVPTEYFKSHNFDEWSVGGHPYNSSWDWLMPVVEKIGRYVYEQHEVDDGIEKYTVAETAYPRTFGMISRTGLQMVRFNGQPLFEADTLIHATWLACIDFIQWYNIHNKQQ